MSKSKIFKRTISITMVMLLLIQSASLFAFAIDFEENEVAVNKIVDGKEVLYEDETKRGDFEKHFLCSDGSYIAATYPEQVNYKDKNGNWVEIDNTLSKTDGRLENKSQELKVSFSQKADDNEMVKLSHNNVDLSWSLSFEGTEAEPENGIEKLLDSTKNFFTDIFTIEKSDQTDYNELKRNINDVKAVVRDFEKTEASAIAVDKIESNLVYEDVFSDSVNASYSVLPGKVKENIILTEKTDLQNYSMHISCEDLFPTITDENCIEFKDINGEVQYIIQAPYMYDNIYELSYDIQITIETVDGGYIITFTPNQEWLNSDDRVYPITIDPTVRTNTTKSNFSDTYIFQGSTASSSRALEERLRVGIYNDKKYKALWKAKTLPSIPQKAIWQYATFNLKLPDETNTSRAFSIYKINSTWESGTVTWAQSGEMTYTILQSNVARNSSNDTVTFSGTNLTNAVKSWYSGTANNGFIFRYTDESFTNPDYNVCYSSDNTTSTSYMPYLSIVYSVDMQVNNLRIYKTENDIRVDKNGNTPEDLMNLCLSKDELCALDWINWTDFVGRDASDFRDSWESLCTLTTIKADEDLRYVVFDMIDRFMSGTGGTYSHPLLTTAVICHKETNKYKNDIINVLSSQIKKYNGDISKLSYPGAYSGSNRDNHPMVSAMIDAQCWSPKYGSSDDAFEGLGICIDSWWASEIIVDSYSYNNGAYSVTLTLNFYDHFGLDTDDVLRHYGEFLTFGMVPGIRSWYILQHYDAFGASYKPFVTKVSFDVSFTGYV